MGWERDTEWEKKRDDIVRAYSNTNTNDIYCVVSGIKEYRVCFLSSGRIESASVLSTFGAEESAIQSLKNKVGK